jgi:hypothetical protein
MKNRLIRMWAFAVLACSVSAQPAFAVTECTKQIYQIYNGDGIIFLTFQGGGNALVYGTNSSFNTITAAALSALLASRTVSVRYAADGVSCGDSRTDVVGLWIM